MSNRNADPRPAPESEFPVIQEFLVVEGELPEVTETVEELPVVNVVAIAAEPVLQATAHFRIGPKPARDEMHEP